MTTAETPQCEKTPASKLAFFLLLTFFLIYPNRTVIVAPDWIVFCFSTASVTLFALGMLCLAPLWNKVRSLPKILACAGGVFCLVAIYHFIRNYGHCPPNELFRSLSYIIIPACTMLYAEEIKRFLPTCATYLWAITIGVSYFEITAMQSPYTGGLPMNINWNAALIVATVPFVLFKLHHFAMNRGKRRELMFYLPAVVVLFLSAHILKICASKGAFIGVITAAAICLALWGKDKVKKPLWYAGIALFVLAIVSGLYCFRGEIEHYLSISDRGFFWRQTMKMFGDHWGLGCGVPFFEQSFLPYRTAEYFLNEFAAVRVNHPHNHYLFIAACTGIFGLVSWLICTLYPLVRILWQKFNTADLLLKICCFSTLALLIHGQVDLILFQEPTNLLFLVLLGLLWQEISDKKEITIKKRLFYKSVGILCIVLSVAMAVLNLYSSCQFRMASRANIIGNRMEAIPRYQACIATSFADNQYYTRYQTALAFITDNKWEQKFAREILLSLKDGTTPDFAHINYYLGCLLLDNGEKKDGIAALLRDADLYPYNPRPFVPLLFAFRDNPIAYQIALAEMNRRIQALKLDITIDMGTDHRPVFTGKDAPLLLDSFSEEPLNKNVRRR